MAAVPTTAVETTSRVDVCVRALTLEHSYKVRYTLEVFPLLVRYVRVRGRKRGFYEVLVSKQCRETNSGWISGVQIIPYGRIKDSTWTMSKKPLVTVL